MTQASPPAPPPVLSYFSSQTGVSLACFARPAQGSDKPGYVWLGGFRSVMNGSKGSWLDQRAADQGRSCLRFDYSGHGQSSGAFTDGTIGLWFEQALEIFLQCSKGPQIVIGSSMGGWIALLLARALAARNESERMCGLLLIAPAVDFTSALLWPQLPEIAQKEIMEKGLWSAPPYGDEQGFPITRSLIEDGARHQLLDGPLRTFCPTHIVQGMRDSSVPWSHALALVERLSEDPVVLSLIPDAEHRLNRSSDLAVLASALDLLSEKA